MSVEIIKMVQVTNNIANGSKMLRGRTLNNGFKEDKEQLSQQPGHCSVNQSINQYRLMRLKIDLRSVLTQPQPGPYNGKANNI